MNDVEQRKAAKAFAANWQGKGYEKGKASPSGYIVLTYLASKKKPSYRDV